MFFFKKCLYNPPNPNFSLYFLDYMVSSKSLKIWRRMISQILITFEVSIIETKKELKWESFDYKSTFSVKNNFRFLKYFYSFRLRNKISYASKKQDFFAKEGFINYTIWTLAFTFSITWFLQNRSESGIICFSRFWIFFEVSVIETKKDQAWDWVNYKLTFSIKMVFIF